VKKQLFSEQPWPGQKHINRIKRNKDSANRALLFFGNILLVITAVYCTFGALISAFSLPVDQVAMFWTWLTGTVVASAVAMRYRGKGLLILAIPVLLIFLLNAEVIITGGKWVIYEITRLYSNWLPVTVLFSESETLSASLENDVFEFIAIAGIVITLLLSYSICLRRSVFTTIVVTAPIVFLTFIITDLQASTMYLFGLIAVYLTLLISSAISPDDYLKRGLRFVPALIMAVVIMVVAYFVAPYENYSRERHIAGLGNRFRIVVSQMGRFGQFWQPITGGTVDFGWLGAMGVGIWQFNTENVSVADAGDRVIYNHNLLEITASEPGDFYLRGYSMQHFDGRSWLINDDSFVLVNDRFAMEMPAFIADVYFITHDFNAPLMVAMHISRTGDLTRNVTYRPYYGGELFYSLSDITFRTAEQFYYIDGSVHELMDSIPTSDDIAIVDYIPFDAVSSDRYLPDMLDEYPDLFNTLTTIRTEGLDEYSTVTNEIRQSSFVTMLETSEGEIITIEGPTETMVITADDMPYGRTFSYDSPDIREILSEVVPGFILGVHAFSPTELLSTIVGENQIQAVYTEIDPATARDLQQLAIAEGINPQADRATIADEVARYIRSSATYSLTPGVIPAGEDFSLYFLQELQEGYCIHFATAAVLMLRSLDIPARFTSGYVATVLPEDVDRPVALTDMNAHAWVEVYYEDVGWLYLEVTPSAGNTYVPLPRPHSPFAQFNPVQPLQLPEEPDDGSDGIPDDNTPSGEALGMRAGNNIWNLHPWLSGGGLALIIILVAAVLPVRRNIKSKIRSKNYWQKNTNKAVVYAWRYINKLGGKWFSAPGDIEELVLKARFSQHRLTEEERSQMIQYVKRHAYEICGNKEGFGRFYLKYIRALC